ncbi:catalase-like [Pectinophora gossypiella]|uniref:catalase-like n=1 Tax=Pectinophora gossypiella TaxID=13191 RepID=UPI00214EFFE6|nr:catalase-like [Pectinophora gossypiella]
MLVVVAALFVTVVTAVPGNVTTADQLMLFKKKTPGPIGVIKTTSGFPVLLEDTQVINKPRIILNDFFMETMTRLNRERIPERFVHTKGTGAFGYFKVTHDLSDICRAKIFSAVGKTTPLVVRFSPTNEERGSSDVTRDARGMAIKFYTDEGNFDLLALTIQQFLMKDPVFFPTFIHVFHRNPKTNVIDNNMIWDFLTLRPETLAAFMHTFGDVGIPDGYRFIRVFALHTYELLNYAGDRTFVRFQMVPDAGVRNLTTAQAARITDVDYATRDLYNNIENGNYPVWTLYVQVIPECDVDKIKFDIFDITRRWPLRKFPLRPIGKLVLNRNPENQFADVEQTAFNPGNLVPGIRGVDTLFESRVFAYRDAQNYRLGANFNNIKVNCPLATITHTYVRDGLPPVLDNDGETPNYFPNSYNGPIPYVEKNYPPRINVYTDPRANNFDDARDLYVNELTVGQRCRLVDNIVTSLRLADHFLQERAVKLYKLIHIDLGSRIQENLLRNNTNPSDNYECNQP